MVLILFWNGVVAMMVLFGHGFLGETAAGKLRDLLLVL